VPDNFVHVLVPSSSQNEEGIFIFSKNMNPYHRFTTRLTHKLGMGTWQFGGPNFVNNKPTGWGHFDENVAIKTLLEAIDAGVQFFDTADSYGRGLSETILGKALIQRADNQCVICTKFGNREIQPNVFIQDFSAEWLKECVHNSLKRLNVSTIDVLLFHSPPDNFDWVNYDTSVLEQLIQEGYIKQYGVSSKSVYGAKAVMDAGFGSVVEVIYNVLDRRAETVLFVHPKASQYDMIGRVPLASGFLSDKYLQNMPTFSTDDYRSLLPQRDLDWFVQRVRDLAFLSDLEGGITGAALNYCVNQPRIAVVIPGTRDTTQLHQHLEVLNTSPLSAQTVLQIQKSVPDVPDWWKPKP
jgi:aryl-alcohol dehydrogenase-like predicted oxidoreductase